MRRANAQLQVDRRATILDAAERCFVRCGFHQTSMQEICTEAGMSAGNLYRYFPSKEALIAGIAERNRAEAAEDFAAVDKATTFFEGLAALARHHLVERNDKITLCVEIMAESRRNETMAATQHEVKQDIKARLAAMIRSGIARGEVSPEVDVEAVTTFLLVIGDGIFWQRSGNPDFDGEKVLPLILSAVHGILTKPSSPRESS